MSVSIFWLDGWDGRWQQSSRKGAEQEAQVWDGEWHFPLGRRLPEFAGHPGGASGSMQLLFQPEARRPEPGSEQHTAMVWTGTSQECMEPKMRLWDSGPRAPGIEEGRARGPLRGRRDLGEHSAPACWGTEDCGGLVGKQDNPGNEETVVPDPKGECCRFLQKETGKKGGRRWQLPTINLFRGFFSGTVSAREVRDAK